MVVAERRPRTRPRPGSCRRSRTGRTCTGSTDGTVGAVDRSLCAGLARRRGSTRCWAAKASSGCSGEGAFAVEEFAVTQLAAALGMSEPAARRYVGQALELRDRLPRLWATVMAGACRRGRPARSPRRPSRSTPPPPPTSSPSGAVRAQDVAAAGSCACVHAAVIRHDRVLAAERAAKAAEGRGVWVDDDLRRHLAGSPRSPPPPTPPRSRHAVHRSPATSPPSAPPPPNRSAGPPRSGCSPTPSTPWTCTPPPTADPGEAAGRRAAAAGRGAPSRARRSTSTCTPTPSTASPLPAAPSPTAPGTWPGSTARAPGPSRPSGSG